MKVRTKKALTAVLVLVLALSSVVTVLAACDTTATMTISTDTANVAVGKTMPLVVKVSKGSQKLDWTTSDASVATVSKEGVVTGVKVGSATITATSGKSSVSCKVTVGGIYTDDGQSYTSKSSMKNTPSNWNEMDYQNNDDTVIINNTISSFFGYDYALKDPSKGRVTADGKLNVDNIDFEHHIVTYEAATKLEDVTSLVDAKWGLTAAQKDQGGYAWRFTLRDDLTWDDGTPIKAGDFVYSMKEQLNYLLQPFRANNYWTANGMKVHNAKNYYYQGRTVDLPLDGLTLDNLDKGADGVYTYQGHSIYLGLRTGIALLDGDSLGDYIDVYSTQDDNPFDMAAWAVLEGAMADKTNGKATVTDDTLAALAKCLAPFGMQEDALGFVFMTQAFAAMTFDEVGIYAEDDLHLVVVLDDPESWLREDGKLSYTISNASLPLVKQDLYERLKKEPAQGSDKWTTTYNTSVETSASWGPYKLASFQVDKQFILERNVNWFGYGIEENRDQYLADRFVVEVIAEEEATKLAFWKGEIDDLEFSYLGATAAEYQNSDYAMFTPASSATAYGIQLYSNLSVLKNSGKNNTILAIKDFRWALSLAFDRNAFVEDQLVGMQIGLGLLGPGYYYDPENSLSYRESDAAKSALLRTYGFTLNGAGKWTDGTTVYADIDAATDAMTGYNLSLAKQKLASAITELKDEKYAYDPSKNIVLRLGKFNDKAARRAELLQSCIDKLTEGSELQGKIKVEIIETNSQKSADDFRDGKFEIYCIAGIGGAVFYPFTSMDSYLGFGDLSYHGYMDTKATITKTMPAGNYEGAGQTFTLTTRDWFNSLNGRMTEGASHNWSEGYCPVEVRLEILAMLEEYALSQHYTIQVANDYNAYLNTARNHNITTTYNTFMGLGGARYTRYVYNDVEWAEFLAQHNNDLSSFYKTSQAD